MAQQERARRTRAAIVEAAAFEFSRRGYAAASVNTILEGSRATKGAMYFHFASKEELARAVMKTAAEEYVAITGKKRSDALDPLEKLHDVVIDIAHTFKANVVVQAEFRLIIEPEFYSEMRGGVGQVWGRTAYELAEEASRLGLFKPAVDPQKFTRVLMACLAGQRYMADLMAVETDLAALFEESLDVVLSAMATPEWLDGFDERGWPARDGSDPVPAE